MTVAFLLNTLLQGSVHSTYVILPLDPHSRVFRNNPKFKADDDCGPSVKYPSVVFIIHTPSFAAAFTCFA
jgi:hypothetical protein